VAIALENARLIEETEKRAQRERTINRITSRIRNAPSINQMLAVAAQELRVETHAARSIAEIAPEAEGPAGNGRPAHGREDERS
jgi:GAF domain-containing protein